MLYIDEKWSKILDSQYEVSNLGRFRRKYKNKYRYLRTYKKGSIQVIKLTINGKAKQYNAAKIVLETFERKINANECAFHKNGIRSDIRLVNLKIMTKSEVGRKTGWQSSRKSIVMLDNEGVILQVFKGTRDAAEKLFISRQTVSDYCNNKVNKPLYKLYWGDTLI